MWLLLIICFVRIMQRSSVEHWAQFFLLWVALGPCNATVLDQVVMMMVALHFNGNVDRLDNGLCMEVSMMFNGHMDADPTEWVEKREKSIHTNATIESRYCQLESISWNKSQWYSGTYLEVLPKAPSAKNVTKIIVIAIQEKICKGDWKCC